MRFFSQVMLYVSIACIAVAVGMIHGLPSALYTFGCSALIINIGERSFRYLDGGHRKTGYY